MACARELHELSARVTVSHEALIKQPGLPYGDDIVLGAVDNQHRRYNFPAAFEHVLGLAIDGGDAQAAQSLDNRSRCPPASGYERGPERKGAKATHPAHRVGSAAAASRARKAP